MESASVTDRLNKLREERIAREKARIAKLRELNLKKYNKNDDIKNSNSNLSIVNKSVKSESNMKNNGAVNNTESKFSKTDKKQVLDGKPQIPRVSLLQKPKLNTNADRKQNFPIRKAEGLTSNVKIRQSLAVANNKPPSDVPRKSMIPQSASNSESVFDRLYKPKPIQNNHKNEIEKLQTDPNYLKKVIRTSGLILNKRHTVFEPAKAKVAVPVRRSISAVHFKRIGKQELGNCIHKWSSIGDKLNNIHLKHINEDENVREEKVVSAVKSVREKSDLYDTDGELQHSKARGTASKVEILAAEAGQITGFLSPFAMLWHTSFTADYKRSVVEANLDQLLDKFMQLKISPNSHGKRREVDPKLVDVKNVFKSTIIRFAVQQAKL
ncbi:hypothetical protein HF086_011016 [Spodoptera exigua]|uniref:Uncharacterized protein n=1 Tax=Spodoptera exigua TaxID=7107 RepID=A0A922MTV1_SPOEX|nr:hypothetical protein HF086_011016 [Spodoptera exigua]